MTIIKREAQEVLFGITPVLPLALFPSGKVRIKMRNNQFVRVFVKQPTGGIREFAVKRCGDYWVPSFEVGANIREVA